MDLNWSFCVITAISKRSLKSMSPNDGTYLL